MIKNNEYMTWTKLVMTYFKKLSQHLCDLSEEKYLKSQSA